jgi:GDP-4-dehydro-6-deoxy-D-mannose reductase
MTKLLITGFSGFVSRHFLEFLEAEQTDAEVLGVGRSVPGWPVERLRHVRAHFRQLDLLDKDGVDDVIYGFRPDFILHLAAYSSVGFSWQKPVESFSNNTNVLLNLLEQVRALNLRCRVLSVGSSEEYGNVPSTALPIREDTPLQPLSPYAVARVAQEMLSQVYVRGYGLDVVMTRSFNHIGPHQREAFVVPSLTRQLTDIKRHHAAPRITTGDRTVVRDFVDVRDVVRAYHGLLLRGVSGEIYNVCSGTGVSIDHVVERLMDIVGVKAELHTDPRLVRPNDNRVIIGSHEKLTRSIGWEPRIALDDSLRSIVASLWPDTDRG